MVTLLALRRTVSFMYDLPWEQQLLFFAASEAILRGFSFRNIFSRPPGYSVSLSRPKMAAWLVKRHRTAPSSSWRQQ
jgi:hypothetical protein